MGKSSFRRPRKLRSLSGNDVTNGFIVTSLPDDKQFNLLTKNPAS
ncbi:hypothetical protein [Spirosoma flavus]